MTQVQIEIPDSDRDLFVRQARREGMTLSAWLCAAGRARLESQSRARPFASAEDAMAFFRACDDLDGPEVEPDWSEHLRVINESRASRSSSAP
ncbi:MAG: hypothetical protein F4047_03760 [Caldilineaceae bacterium SB0670_bin_27]|uniref:Antitoxin n=1 Tax=Caldilineaceae bacterium SB0664_bin_27 TaxID=2605260 RepID=A0A6B0YTH0_9CHLR|nr:hypothetical protein [Caldilineaceae bacterium]MDE0340384.1 hypothetical protein [Caldilineaceae bacterium]MXY94340.1 hypothetical protein [Caldilineaceae bacterium SB0664_bin_27]MYJ77272.1 hypothetical protein [Caldilineaceae bacterium SB0670_bin_27]